MAGEQEYDEGQIATDKEISIGFLKQDIDFVKGRTVLEEAYEAFVIIRDLEQKLEHINTQLSEREDYESEGYHQLMIDLNDIQHQYEIHGGYTYQGETERILQGLGFQREDFHMPTETFSGGWRMRIELAKLLLQTMISGIGRTYQPPRYRPFYGWKIFYKPIRISRYRFSRPYV